VASPVTNITLDVAPSAVATYSLVYPDSNDEVLRYTINYAPDGLKQQEIRLGTMINTILTDRTSPNFDGTAAAIYAIADVDTLGKLYDVIGGQGVTAAQTTALTANGYV